MLRRSVVFLGLAAFSCGNAIDGVVGSVPNGTFALNGAIGQRVVSGSKVSVWTLKKQWPDTEMERVRIEGTVQLDVKDENGATASETALVGFLVGVAGDGTMALSDDFNPNHGVFGRPPCTAVMKLDSASGSVNASSQLVITGTGSLGQGDGCVGPKGSFTFTLSGAHQR